MKSRLFYMLALLTVTMGVRAAQLPDFTGAEIVERGFCMVNDDQVECMEVTKDNKFYVIMHTGFVIHLIFKVKEGATRPYLPHMLEQIYPPKGVAI